MYFIELLLLASLFCFSFHSSDFFFFRILILFIYLFYFCLCWVFISVRELSLAATSRGHCSSRCAGLSLSRSLLLRSTGSRRAVSVIVAHGRSCSAAQGIFPDQGSNPCPRHQQADSQPLRYQRNRHSSDLDFFFSSCLQCQLRSGQNTVFAKGMDKNSVQLNSIHHQPIVILQPLSLGPTLILLGPPMAVTDTSQE